MVLKTNALSPRSIFLSLIEDAADLGRLFFRFIVELTVVLLVTFMIELGAIVSSVSSSTSDASYFLRHLK